MAVLQFVDNDGNIKDIANVDSPSFTGEGTTDNPNESNANQIINFRYLKKLLTKEINSIKTDTAESSSNTLTGLVPGADYLISMYGLYTLNYDPSFPYEPIWASEYPDDYIFINETQKVFIEDEDDPLPAGYVRIGYFAVVDKGGNELATSDITARKIDWPNEKGSFPGSATLRITAPVDGFVYGYMNYGISFAPQTPVKYMCAVRLNDEKVETYKASIIQQERQTIIVTANGIDYKENFTALPGTEFTTRSEGYPGYKGGTVSPSSGTFDRNIIFTVSAATTTTYTITIEQSEHQTITVTYNGNNYTSTITNVPLNSVLIARITSVDYGYNAGKVNVSTLKVKEDSTIYATEATPINYPITITQKENELIRVTNEDMTYEESFNAPYLSTINISITSLSVDEYIKGSLIIDGVYTPTGTANQYTVGGAITITASTATPINPEPEPEGE